MTTLSDLLTIPTKDQVLDKLVAFARLIGFPVAAWQSTSVPRAVFEGEAFNLADLATSIRAIAAGGFLDLAAGAWLDLLAASVYQETRKPAAFARHTVTLAAAATAGPYTVVAGSYWVTTADRSKRFVVVDLPNGPTLPLGGTLTVTVQAESPGAAYNVAPGTITQQVTPFAGVTVTNPAGATGSSIVQQGTDAETDDALKQRCRDKWSTLGSGSTDAAYRYWATSASSEVTRVKVTSDPTTGFVTTTVAGPSGPISSTAFALVDAAIASKGPLGVTKVRVNAVAAPVSVAGVLYLAPGAVAASTQQAAQDAIDAYFRTVDIAGSVYTSSIIAAAQGVAGVRHVAMTQPPADVALGPGQVATGSYALTTVAA